MRRCWRKVCPIFEKSGLQGEYVFTQLEILVLQGAMALLNSLKVLHLLFQLLYVPLFALSKSPLVRDQLVLRRAAHNATYLGSSILCSSLARRKLSLSLLSVRAISLVAYIVACIVFIHSVGRQRAWARLIRVMRARRASGRVLAV